MPVEEQIIAIFAGVKGYLDKISLPDVNRFEQAALKAIHLEHFDILESLSIEKAITEKTDEKLHTFFKNFVKIFV